MVLDLCSPSGYTALMPWQGVPLEEALPTCQPGDAFTVDELRLVERQTGPPDYLTEAELITLMEKHGIGTDTRLAETGRASELCGAES